MLLVQRGDMWVLSIPKMFKVINNKEVRLRAAYHRYLEVAK